MVAARRGSLIVSELFNYASPVGGFGNFGHYLEVYNNADTTIFLDRVLIFRTSIALHQAFPEFPCTQYNVAHRTDPNALWVSYVRAFPGNGRDHPIRPGEAKVIAMDAIDHRPLDGNLQDLTRADFEEIGTDADPNNPAAADLVNITPGIGLPIGHGLPIAIPTAIGLALPFANTLAQLTEQDEYNYTDGARYAAYRIPREAILDFASIDITPEKRAALGATRSGLVRCEPFLSNTFERAEAKISSGDIPMAIARKTLGHTASGIEILQRTHTSARDFELVQPLRRSLNK